MDSIRGVLRQNREDGVFSRDTCNIHAPISIFACIRIGEYLLKNNDPEEAVQFAIFAYKGGVNFLKPKPVTFTPEMARLGGIKKAEKCRYLKTRAIRLYKELALQKSGMSKTAIVEAVCNELREVEYSVILNTSGLRYYNLERTIGGWIRADQKKNPENYPFKTSK